MLDVTHFKDLHDVRMLQPCDRLRLDQEPLTLLLPLHKPAPNHLESNTAMQLVLLSQVNNTHAPFAQLLEDAITGNEWKSRLLRRRRHGLPIARVTSAARRDSPLFIR